MEFIYFLCVYLTIGTFFFLASEHIFEQMTYDQNTHEKSLVAFFIILLWPYTAFSLVKANIENKAVLLFSIVGFACVVTIFVTVFGQTGSN
jgi:hypothetical protein